MYTFRNNSGHSRGGTDEIFSDRYRLELCQTDGLQGKGRSVQDTVQGQKDGRTCRLCRERVHQRRGYRACLRYAAGVQEHTASAGDNGQDICVCNSVTQKYREQRRGVSQDNGSDRLRYRYNNGRAGSDTRIYRCDARTSCIGRRVHRYRRRQHGDHIFQRRERARASKLPHGIAEAVQRLRQTHTAGQGVEGAHQPGDSRGVRKETAGSAGTVHGADMHGRNGEICVQIRQISRADTGIFEYDVGKGSSEDRRVPDRGQA